MTVDTLTLARELRAASIEPEQAEAIAAAIGRAVAKTAATKADLVQLGTELRCKIAQVRAEVARQGAELHTEIERSGNVQTRWTIGSLFTFAALVVAIVKFVPALG